MLTRGGTSYEMKSTLKSCEMKPCQMKLFRLTSSEKNRRVPQMEVKLENGSTLILCPRVRMVYNMCANKDRSYLNPREWTWRLEDVLPMQFSVASRPISITEKDVVCRFFNSPIRKREYRDAYVGAQVTVCCRDLSFIPGKECRKAMCLCSEESISSIAKSWEQLLEAGRKFIVEEAPTITITLDRRIKYELRPTSRPSEYQHPDSMLAAFAAAQPDYLEGVAPNPPVIELEGLPAEWFSEQPGASEPSHSLLRSFLSIFGAIRELDVAKNELNENHINVLVQYNNNVEFNNAFRILCPCLLQNGPGGLPADFKVRLRTNC